MKKLLIALTSLVIVVVIGLLSCGDNPTQNSNQPPSTPQIDGPSGSPGNGSTGQSITPVLRWTCNDPDDDELVYDVFFGKVNPPARVSSNQTTTSHTPGSLSYATKYFWKIVAKDDQGATTESSLWSFTTVTEPPETISTPSPAGGPSAGKVNQLLTFSTGGASSSLGHSLQYLFDWGDGSQSNWSYGANASHAWGDSGTYYIKTQARCASHTSRTSSWSNSRPVVISQPDVPALKMTPESLDFDSSQTAKTFSIQNIGTGTLYWNITVSDSWLSVNNSSGTTTTETDQVTVSVNRSGLGPGSYSGQVIVSSINGGTDTVEVSMVVPSQPVLCVSPTSLGFGSTLTSLPFYITNCGSGTLTWEVLADKSWIQVNPASGSTTTETDIVTVTVDRSGLPPGTYSGTVSVSSNGGSATVEISMTVSCNIAVTDPHSGRTWTKGNNYSIRWTQGSGSVKLELLKDGSKRCTITSSTANDGSHPWTVDDCGGGTSANYQIKITDLSNSNCSDYSDMFTILVPETSWVYVGEDAMIMEEEPGMNFDGYPNSVGWGNGLELWSLIKFSLSGIPQDAEIVNAYLHLHASSALGNPPYWKINLANRSWNEATVTWSIRPGRIPPESTFPPPGYVQWYAYRVSNHVEAWLTGSNNYGFILSPSSTSGSGLNWTNFSDGSSSFRPKLEVIYYRQP